MNNSDESYNLAGQRIALLIQQHFASAPRAQKEAHALSKAGAEVTVFGSWWDEDRSIEDLSLAEKFGVRFVPLIDLRPGQRVGLASALYHETELHILDEATSALDDKTDAIVMKAIRSLKGNITMIIIAHRLSTIIDCDSQLRLDFESRTNIHA